MSKGKKRVPVRVRVGYISRVGQIEARAIENAVGVVKVPGRIRAPHVAVVSRTADGTQIAVVRTRRGIVVRNSKILRREGAYISPDPCPFCKYRLTCDHKHCRFPKSVRVARY